MRATVLIVMMALAGTALSGCFGGAADGDFAFEPGKNYRPTGTTVHLKMWVADIGGLEYDAAADPQNLAFPPQEIYPGLDANLWAFCAAPVDPNHQPSVDAIEHWDPEQPCSVPGPTIRVQQGDLVKVEFKNDHFHPHTIHWHGQHVPHESDGVPGVNQDSVVTGKSFSYEFEAKRAGTLWYHCHVDTQFHVMMGLYGMFIVEPQDTTYEPKDIDDEFYMIMSTARREHIQHITGADPHANHRHTECGGQSGLQGCQNPAVSVEPDVWMLNGLAHPNTMDAPGRGYLTLEPGERVRLRMLNAGETFETWHFHGHDVLVTHRDGNPLPPDSRFWVETLTIGPAERYDVVIEGSEAAAGVWVMHTHVERHLVNDKQAPGGAHSMIVYPGFEDQMHTFAAELAGGQPYQAPRPLQRDFHFDETRSYWATESAVGQTGSVEVSDSFVDFEVKDLCLVDKVYLSFHLSGDASDLRSSELAFTLTPPDALNGSGEQAEGLRVDLAADTGTYSVSWYPNFEDLAEGVYGTRLSGRAVDLTATLSVEIDYFPSEAIAKEYGRPCKGDGHAHAH